MRRDGCSCPSSCTISPILVVLPMSPDPATFVQITGRMREAWPALHNRGTTHPMPEALTETTTTLPPGASSGKRQAIPLPNGCTIRISAFAG